MGERQEERNGRQRGEAKDQARPGQGSGAGEEIMDSRDPGVGVGGTEL